MNVSTNETARKQGVYRPRADYGHVYALVGEAFRAAQAEGIVKADRDMVAAAGELSTPPNGKPGERPVSQAALRAHLKLSKSTASYRVKRLLASGYLANLEENKGRAMKLVPGAPLPDEPAPLPSPCELAEHLVRMGRPELVNPFMDPVTGAVHDCRQHIAEIDWAEIQPLSSPLNLEPCPRCKTEAVPGDKGFITSEPIEPPVQSEVQGFNRVQSRMNPFIPVTTPGVGDAEGSTPPPEEGRGFSTSPETQGPAASSFSLTEEWQEVSEEVVLPAGAEVRMDMATGRNFARLPNQSGDASASDRESEEYVEGSV